MIFRTQYRELIERIKRLKPLPHKGFDRYGLDKNQIYPEGVNFYKCLAEQLRSDFKNLSLTGNTPIASIGSCFAEHFAPYMISNGFNYLKEESNVYNFSANWGRVYTVPNLCQIIGYSTGDFPIVLEETACRSYKKRENGWFDPLRDGSPTLDKEMALSEINFHRCASRKVFATAKILIITLGQNEGWRDKETNFVWANRPPEDKLGKRFSYETFKDDLCLEILEKGFKTIFSFNPELKVLLTVSPVPLFATFHKRGIITESFVNKCLLRVVVEKVMKKFSNVYYFPSFEAVLAYNPYSLRADNRHVMPSMVDRILRLLEIQHTDRKNVESDE